MGADVETVVKAIGGSDILPECFRTLIGKSLPNVLETYRVDRHPFEAEVVDAAEKALGDLKAHLEELLNAASAKQSEITSPAEKAKREAAKTALETELKDATAKLEERTQQKQAAATELQQATTFLKEKKKAVSKASADLQKATDQKTELTSAIAGELEFLRNSCSSSSAGKKALKTIAALGKLCRLEQTLLASFPLACKKEVEARTESDNLMFKEMASALEKKLAECTKEVSELEVAKTRQEAESEEAGKTLDAAQEGLTKAEEAIKDARTVVKDVKRNLDGAVSYSSCIWSDMKEACEATERASRDLKAFTEDLLPTFQRLQNKEREPEVAEADEMET